MHGDKNHELKSAAVIIPGLCSGFFKSTGK